jgi:hypothetical protein
MTPTPHLELTSSNVVQNRDGVQPFFQAPAIQRLPPPEPKDGVTYASWLDWYNKEKAKRLHVRYSVLMPFFPASLPAMSVCLTAEISDE